MRRYQHDLSYGRLLSLNLGELAVCGVKEVLMADTFRHRTTALLRVEPLVTPVMHAVRITVQHWYMPYRIIFPEWEEFITGGDGKKAAPEIPTVTSGAAGGYLDQMGLPPGIPGNYNALPLMAVNRIINENYLDQDLDTERSLTDESSARVRWSKDYFTTARLDVEKGPPVTIPISGSTVPIKGIGRHVTATTPGGPDDYVETGGETVTYPKRFTSDAHSQPFAIRSDNVGTPEVYAAFDSGGVGIDPNEFRAAMAWRRFQELRNRYGHRYIDYLRMYGVRPSDGRLDRAEFLGGGRQMISFSEVLDHGSSETNVGKMSGHGISAFRSRPYRRFFEEHGVVISFMFARPRTVYGQGVHRSWLRRTNKDYWQRELEVLPVQPIYTKELYGAAADNDVFGYGAMHDDYRRLPSYVSGTFRNTPDYNWHFARLFSEAPQLNSTFLECKPADRPFADKQRPHLLVNAAHSVTARRLVRRRSRP